jgi:hypothetical protein
MANENTGIVPEDRGGSTVSPQPSRDPVYQPGETRGGTDPSGQPPRNVSSDLRSVMPDDAGTRTSFVGFPQTKYHPVYGARVVNDPNEAASLPGPAHNWFNTPGEADMHRTDREAQQVIHHNRSVKIGDKLAFVNGEEPPTQVNQDRNAIVRNSVQAQESLDRGTEPVI